ncbi:protein OBERON 1 [Euphorbia lathyris]|uniref:protein OBERON 1 n=1 Tax=Euphorbia lathyris TaxID=212925 RepID=UPI003313CDC1
MEFMEVDEITNGSAPGIKENGFDLRPVAPEEYGEGLPYAPVDWPKPGDVWTWRVGKRIASNGHFVDRYLYPPLHLARLDLESSRNSKKRGLASKPSVERFIHSIYPDADVKAFFASFSWKIPSKMSSASGNLERNVLSRFEETAENSEPPQSDGVACKAGNKKCNSLVLQTKNPSVGAMACDICCSEPRFCRDCCCILCCKTIKSKHGGFSYIKCEALVCEGCICGHVAHVDCALRTYMAGTVGGSIGLDVEYYCRRCDARIDLIPHVRRIFQTCKSIHSCEKIEKVLNVGICILRGSQKTVAIELLRQFEAAIVKLKCGAKLEDLWNAEEDIRAISTEQTPDAFVDADKQDHSDIKTNMLDTFSLSSEYRAETVKLEDEIDQTLYELRKSQASEYSIAEEQLHAQKNCIQNLYEQLERDRFKLARKKSDAKRGALLAAIAKREDQIKKEVAKLKNMEEVAKGFGRTSKSILNELFGLEVDE